MSSRAKKKRLQREKSMRTYMEFREGVLSGRIGLEAIAPRLAAAIDAALQTEQDQ